MDLARRMYSRDLKIAAMREIDGGRPIGEVARHLELSPHLLERWRSEWRAQGQRGQTHFSACICGPLSVTKKCLSPLPLTSRLPLAIFTA